MLTKIRVENDAQPSRKEERCDQTPQLREWELEHPWEIEYDLFGADEASMGR